MLDPENRDFEKFGISKTDIEKFKVLLLPENFEEATDKDALYDATDAVHLSKKLKGQGVSCANSLDLNLNPKILDRRGEEFWFGIIYVIDSVVLPILTSLLAALIIDAHKDKDQKIVYKSKVSKVHLKLKLEKASGSTTIKYDGDPKTLIKVLEGLQNN